VALAGLATLFAAPNGLAAQTEALHSIKFYVHHSLVGEQGTFPDLTSWTEFIDGTLLRQATIALEGTQGPHADDAPCCTRIERSGELETFDPEPSQFDVIQFQGQYDALEALHEGTGNRAYIVPDLRFCNGSMAMTIIGCAELPGDFLVVDVDNLDGLGLAIAHERGHNASLLHPGDRDPVEVADPCDLMAPTVGGGCLSTVECATYSAAGPAAGESCPCHGNAPGDASRPNGSACSDDSGCGVCSGGLCGACFSEAGVRLIASGGVEDPTSAAPDDFIEMSAFSGGWEQGAPISSEIEGLAYDPVHDVVYGVRPEQPPCLNCATELVTIDPDTGAVASVVGSLGGSFEPVTALAYDPSSDVLYATQVIEDSTTLLSIDPSDGSATELGPLDILVAGGVQGLAFDSILGILFGSAGTGLKAINPLNCSPTCSTFPVEEGSSRFVNPSALAFDPISGKLFRTGFGTRSVFHSLDPSTGEVEFLVGVKSFTPGGLAALPVPEPPRSSLVVVAVAVVGILSLRSPGRPTRRLHR
jgi:hypothetical protein